MSQEPTEQIKSYTLYWALEMLENQFTLITIYLVEIARGTLRKKNEIFNVARLFSAIKPLNVPKNEHYFTSFDWKTSQILPFNFICSPKYCVFLEPLNI
jgi:hypothetical protein